MSENEYKIFKSEKYSEINNLIYLKSKDNSENQIIYEDLRSR